MTSLNTYVKAVRSFFLIRCGLLISLVTFLIFAVASFALGKETRVAIFLAVSLLSAFCLYLVNLYGRERFHKLDLQAPSNVKIPSQE